MKGVKDFADWLDGACDLTYKSYSVSRDVSYNCYLPEMQIEKVDVLLERCNDKNITVTRGYGEGKICCPTSECVYMQDVKCVYQNELCMANRKLFVEQSPAITKSLKDIYLQYDEFSARARGLEYDVRTIQIKLQRAHLKLNRTVAGLQRAKNTLKKLETNQKLLVNQERRIASIVYRDKSLIAIEKVEFDIVQYSPKDLKRLPLRITLSDINNKKSYLDISMDGTQLIRSIRSIINVIVEDAVNYISIPTQKRRRRSVSFAANVSISEQKHDVAYWSHSCRKFNEAFGLIKAIILNLQDNNATTKMTKQFPQIQQFNSPGRTTASLLALQKEFELGTMDTIESDKEALARWRQKSEDILSDNLGAVCGGFDDCVEEQIIFLKQLYEPTMDGSERSLKSLSTILKNLQHLTVSDVSNERVLKIKDILLNEMRSVESNTYFCDDHPILTNQMPMLKKAYQGEYFELRCSIDGPAGIRYTWTRNGTILPTQNEWILKINSVSTEDQGIYVCHGETLTNKVSSNQIFVPVRQPIRFKSQPEDHVMRYPGGDQVDMVCNVTSSSVELSYTWWFKSYSNNNKQLVSRSSILHIKSVRSSNIGVYWCEVTDGQIFVKSRESKIDVVRIVPRKESARVQLSVASLTKHSQRCQLPSDGSASVTIKSLFETKLRNILPPKVADSFKVTYQVNSEGQAKLNIDLNVGSTVDQASTKETGFALKVSYERSKLKSSINEFLNEMKNNVVRVSMGNCSYVTKRELTVDWLKEQDACPRGMEASKDVVYCGKCILS